MPSPLPRRAAQDGKITAIKRNPFSKGNAERYGSKQKSSGDQDWSWRENRPAPFAISAGDAYMMAISPTSSRVSPESEVIVS